MRFALILLNLLPKWFRKRLFIILGLATRAMTLGVRMIVRDEKGRVLLVRHTYTAGWHFPGGGVERGETLLDAVKKELQEECDIQIAARPEHFHTYHNAKTSRYDHVALYICHQWEGTGLKEPDHEIAEVGFFPIDDLPPGTTKDTAVRLAEVFDGREIRDNW